MKPQNKHEIIPFHRGCEKNVAKWLQKTDTFNHAKKNHQIKPSKTRPDKNENRTRED